MSERYVSRGGDKLKSVATKFELNFKGKTVLDVGSSTGGFSDFALQNGAGKIIAVDSGSNQLHTKLRQDNRVELHEKTDIRDYPNDLKNGPIGQKVRSIDLILVDVSFVSLREILPSLAKLCTSKTQIVALLKPQFEAGDSLKNKGVIKNEKIRREILKNFEMWAKHRFVINNKADSEVHGLKGNRERFYLLSKL